MKSGAYFGFDDVLKNFVVVNVSSVLALMTQCITVLCSVKVNNRCENVCYPGTRACPRDPIKRFAGID